MRRRLFKLAMVICLMLEVLTLWGWVRSRYVMDRWIVSRDMILPTTYHSFDSRIYLSGGTIEATLETGFNHPTTWRGISHTSVRGGRLIFNWGPAAPDIWERVGLRMVSMPTGGIVPFRSTVIDVPFWLLAILFALLPVWGLRPRKELPKGICVHCGYDLRATPERCPECGNVPVREAL